MTAIASPSKPPPAAGDFRSTSDVAPVLVARSIAVLLLVMAITAGFAELGVRSALVVPGDAARTAARILAAPRLFRLGFAGYLVAFLLDIPVALLFYALLKPTTKALSAVSASLRLAYAALALANLHNYLGERLDAYEHGFKVALVLFGVHLLLLGALLFRSGLLPRTLGVLIAVAGCAYLTDSLSPFASPSVHAAIAPYLAVPASFEILLAAWLLAKGVRRLRPSSPHRASSVSE